MNSTNSTRNINGNGDNGGNGDGRRKYFCGIVRAVNGGGASRGW